MLKIGIVDDRENAKEVMMCLLEVFEEEIIFYYYEYLSNFINKKDEIQLLILSDKYNNSESDMDLFKLGKPLCIIYTNSKVNPFINYGRIFYIHNINPNAFRYIKDNVMQCLKSSREYYLSYNGVKVILQLSDIYYIEKLDKNLIYHTIKGKYYERGAISSKEKELNGADFIRIHSSYLVNFNAIFKIENNQVTLNNQEVLPISRNRKEQVFKFIKQKI